MTAALIPDWAAEGQPAFLLRFSAGGVPCGLLSKTDYPAHRGSWAFPVGLACPEHGTKRRAHFALIPDDRQSKPSFSDYISVFGKQRAVEQDQEWARDVRSPLARPLASTYRARVDARRGSYCY